jgi:hypothetical protein
MSDPEWGLAHVARHPDEEDEAFNLGLTAEERKLQKAMLAEFEHMKRHSTFPVPIPRSERPVPVAESSTRTATNVPPPVDLVAITKIHNAAYNAGLFAGKQAVQTTIHIADTLLFNLELEVFDARKAVETLEQKVKEARAAVDQLKLS